MNFVNYISNSIIPVIITIIVLYGIIEKVKVFDIFLEGATEGIQIVVKLFPTLVGLFVAIGVLRCSGIIDNIINIISPVISRFGIPKEIMPLAFLRPISRKCFSSNWYRYNKNIWGR